MTTLQTRPEALDPSAHEFIATFMPHVAAVAGYGPNRIVTIERVKALLLDALSHAGGPSSNVWGDLYKAIVEIVAADDGRHARSAHAYLQSFIQENGDLA